MRMYSQQVAPADPAYDLTRFGVCALFFQLSSRCPVSLALRDLETFLHAATAFSSPFFATL